MWKIRGKITVRPTKEPCGTPLQGNNFPHHPVQNESQVINYNNIYINQVLLSKNKSI